MTKILKTDSGETCDKCGEAPDYLAVFTAFPPVVCYLCYDCLVEAAAMIEIRQMNATAGEEGSGATEIPN